MRRGRPLKSELETAEQSKRLLLEAVEGLVVQGEKVTVRSVCQLAGLSTGTFYYHFRDKDDLLGYYLTQSIPNINDNNREVSFTKAIFRLYQPLLQQYERLGRELMRDYYSGNNQALSRYFGEVDGQFITGTVMSKCQILIEERKKYTTTLEKYSSFQLSSDICILIKGCVFDWCLSPQHKSLEETAQRILSQFLNNYDD